MPNRAGMVAKYVIERYMAVRSSATPFHINSGIWFITSTSDGTVLRIAPIASAQNDSVPSASLTE